ncbi:MAG TPA: hypothetical protein VGP46_02435, partial [Acidimicrobiales bacterium]|nr:hypothetical protein [Acidimicrobiales bacterium]
MSSTPTVAGRRRSLGRLGVAGRRRPLGRLGVALGVAGLGPTAALAATPSAAAVAPTAAALAGVPCTTTNVLDTWSLTALANQTIAFPAEETDLSAVSGAAEDGYGGILLFGSQAPSDLGSQLASLRSQVPDGLGLIVMTDEEGGGVQRMANLVG